MVRLLAEWSDSKSNVKLGVFRSQLQASYVSSHTEELWYNETVCLWLTIYIYIYIYIYIKRERERLKNKVIQREESYVKESQRYKVSVLMNHHQDLERIISSDVKSPMDF